MAYQIESFKSRYEMGIRLLEEHVASIQSNVKELTAGTGRTGHINKIKESMDKIRVISASMKNLSLEDKMIAQKAKERVEKIIQQAIVLSNIGE